MIKYAGVCLILYLLISLSGCAAESVVVTPVEVRQEVIYQDKIVPVPERMTTAVPYPDIDEDADTIDLGIAFQERGIWLKQCSVQLDEIRKLVPEN